MKIKINNIESYRSPESISYDVDDRVERIPLINGNCVQDYGYIPSGDSFSITALFSQANFNEIVSLWVNRTLITFTDESGRRWERLRIVMRRYERLAKFPNYVMLTFELWRI